MEVRESIQQGHDLKDIDDLLLPLLEADEEQYGALLSVVIEEHAEPLIRKIIGSKLQVCSTGYFDAFETDGVRDLCGEAILKLIAHLKLMRIEPADYGIKVFPDFVAKVAFNVYNNYLREKYPRRHRLKKRICYLLKIRGEFEIWEEGFNRVAGFARWKNIQLSQTHSPALIDLIENNSRFTQSKLNGEQLLRVPLDQLLTKLFEWTGHPIEVEILVAVIADLLKINDQPNLDWHDSIDCSNGKSNEEELFERMAIVPANELQQMEAREFLTGLWEEIVDLPIRQRQALLLSLRDERGSGLINLWVICGIASPLQIASALEISQEELEKIWNLFPLKDAVIGQMIGTNSQKVINLRKSARERLARRMKRRMISYVKYTNH